MNAVLKYFDIVNIVSAQLPLRKNSLNFMYARFASSSPFARELHHHCLLQNYFKI